MRRARLLVATLTVAIAVGLVGAGASAFDAGARSSMPTAGSRGARS